MSELFIKLSQRISNESLVISSLSEKCRELLKPWKCEDNVKETENSPEDDELDVAEKQQLEMLDKVLQRAVQIRTIIDQEITPRTNKDTQASKPQNKLLSDKTKRPSKPDTRIETSKQNSSNNKSTIPLSQLQSLTAKKTSSIVRNSPHKKIKPVHMSAPFKTFAQFKFPSQLRTISRKTSIKNVKSASSKSSSPIKKSFKRESIPSDIPSSDPPPTHRSDIHTVINTTPSADDDDDDDDGGGGDGGDGDDNDDGQIKRGELNAEGKDFNQNNSRIDDDVGMPSFVSLADIGKFLKMPPSYSDLSSRNNILKRDAAKDFNKFDSRRNNFFESLQSHMRNNSEVEELFTTHELFQHYEALLLFCNDVGRPTFSEKSSSSHLQQLRHFISTIKKEFEMHSEEASYLINKEISFSGRCDDDEFLKTKVDEILSRGLLSSIICYQDLQQINEYQKSYEKLLSLKIKKFLFTLLMPHIELLKSMQTDSENFRKIYRSVHSLVNSNGLVFPAFIGNINHELADSD